MEEQRTIYTEAQRLVPAAEEIVKENSRKAIYPGRPWRDTEGKLIQAHGGALFYENGIYYWYGENKDRTDGKCPVWTWGIRAYSSRDLCNWKDEGLIIPPNLTNPASSLYPEKRVDRPHIVKCDATGKYVCWLKLSGKDACFAVLMADRFLGPYQMVMEHYLPMGRKAGDFDLIKDADGRAYLFFDADHAGVLGMELSGDYLRVEREVSRQYMGLHAPFCREGIAVVEHGGRKYMLTSGMSGYIPNQSDAAVAQNWTDSFVSIGDPYVDDVSRSSFNSQISQIFQVPGKKELYIALADRWVPEYVVDARRANLIRRAIASHFDPEQYQVTAEEKMELRNSPMLESANTSIAAYVWLPVEFVDGRVEIRWQEEWSPEDYD